MYTNKIIKSLKKEILKNMYHWGFEGGHIELLVTSENVTFLIKKEKENLAIIRVYRPNYHTVSEILSEHDWIFSIKKNDIVNVAAPLFSQITGESIVPIVIDGEQEFLISAFEFCEGKSPRVDDSLLIWFEKLGEISAKLHEHAQVWNQPKMFTRKKWSLDNMIGNNGLWGYWRNSKELTESDKIIIDKAINKIYHKLKQYGESKNNHGLIHADLRLANLLVHGDMMTIIDFDDCGLGWFAYEFAAAISFHELDPIVKDLKKSWIKGYKKIRVFTEEDEKILSTLILVRRIQLTAWLTTHAESDPVKDLVLGKFSKGTVKLANNYLDA